MIKNFRCKDTERIYRFEQTHRWDAGIRKTALRKLKWMDAAMTLDDLRMPPGNRLEKLKGNRRDQYSIRINDQWRICFNWQEGHALNVEIVDYH